MLATDARLARDRGVGNDVDAARGIGDVARAAMPHAVVNLADLSSRASVTAAGLHAAIEPARTAAHLHDAAALLRELHVGTAALDRPAERATITHELLAAVDALLIRVGTAPLAQAVPERAVAEAGALRSDLGAVRVDDTGRLVTEQFRRSWIDTADSLDLVADGIARAGDTPTRATHPIAHAVDRARAGVEALGPPRTVALTDVPAAVRQLTPVLADLDAAAPRHLAGQVVAALHAADVAAIDAAVRPHLTSLARALGTGSGDALVDAVARPAGATVAAMAGDTARPATAARSTLSTAARELDLLGTAEGAAVRADYARLESTATSAAASAPRLLRATATHVDAVHDLLASVPTSVPTPTAHSRAADLALARIGAHFDASAPMLNVSVAPSARRDLDAARRGVTTTVDRSNSSFWPAATARGTATSANFLRTTADRTELVTRRAGATDATTSISAARDAFAAALDTAHDFERLDATVPQWRAGTDTLESAWMSMHADLPAPVEDAVGGRIAAFDEQLRTAETALARRAAGKDRIAESSFPHLALAARLRQDVETLDLVRTTQVAGESI